MTDQTKLEEEFNKAIEAMDEERINELMPLLIKKKPNELFKAIEEGDLKKVALLIDGGAPLEKRFFGGTPLLTAIFELTEMDGLEAYHQKRGERLPEKYAKKMNNLLEIIYLLIQKGADINVCAPDKTSALRLASTLRDSSLAEFLKQKGAQ